MYRKPNGEQTDNAEEMVEAWKKLAAPIEEATGWKLYAFDPDLAFTSPQTWRSVSLPVEFAQALSKALSQSDPELLERYEDLLFAQRAGKLTPAQGKELAEVEGALCALRHIGPEHLRYEQDMAFFANLLRKKMEEE